MLDSVTALDGDHVHLSQHIPVISPDHTNRGIQIIRVRVDIELAMFAYETCRVQ